MNRDLKPDNIGFDVRGDVKIFDFGLAKEIDPSKRLEDGTFKLTGDTGSLRYMAPGTYPKYGRYICMVSYRVHACNDVSILALMCLLFDIGLALTKISFRGRAWKELQRNV